MAIIRASKENDVVNYVLSEVSPLFHVKQEVEGCHIRGKKKRIDMVIYPRDELVEQSFPKIPVGVEIKTNVLDDGNKKQIIELFHQAIGYRHTRFYLKNGPEFLPMILIYPPMKNYLKNDEPEFCRGFEYIASRLAGKYFIGELFLGRDCEHRVKIDLCGSTYFKLGHDGRGNRFNLNWGFEKYEEEKKILRKQGLSPGEYDVAICRLSEKLGL